MLESISTRSSVRNRAVREDYRDLIDIQLVAFPQSGILKSPGTQELLDEAIKLSADLVGALDPASFDRDMNGHLDVAFGVAEKHGVDIDILLHDAGSMMRSQSRRFAREQSRLRCRLKLYSAIPMGWATLPRTQPERLLRPLQSAASRS